MPILQKISLISLAMSVVVYGWYFLSIFHLSSAGPIEMDIVRPLMIKMAILLVVLIIIAPVLFILVFQKRDKQDTPADERDWLIWTRTGSKSIHFLYAGVMITLGLVLFEFRAVIIAHVLLGTLALTDIARMALMLIDYRRGI